MTNSPANPGASDATIEAFHMMWDSFPHGVLLLNRSRDIIAVNKRAEERGVRTGIKCYQLTGNNNEIHQGCKANQALDEAAAQRVVTNNEKSNKLIVTYWLPVSADKDLYLHFNIDADLPEKT
jgi:hypothetical protein